MVAIHLPKTTRGRLLLLSWTVATAGMSFAPSAIAAPGDVPTAPTIAVGSPFPDFLLPSLADGTPTSINKYSGKKVILHIFASW